MRAPQVLHQTAQLARDHPPAEEICAELERRLRDLPYVLDASWLPFVVVDNDDPMLEGVVTMRPMEELPEDLRRLSEFPEPRQEV